MFSFLLLTASIVAGADAAGAMAPIPPPNTGGVYVVAHRGAHAEGIPENTLAAIARAIELGADFVEVDVRTTKDGYFVNVHNSTIDAYTKDATGKVGEFTLAELKQLDIGSRVDPKWKNERIPTLVEVLTLCQGKIGLYIDLKDAPILEVYTLIKQFGMLRTSLWYAGRDEIAALRAVSPEALIMIDPDEGEDVPKTIRELNIEVAAPVWGSISEQVVKDCHRAGALCIVDEDWGEVRMALRKGKVPDSWRTALGWGIDGIQTDHPKELIAYLRQQTTKE